MKNLTIAQIKVLTSHFPNDDYYLDERDGKVAIIRFSIKDGIDFYTIDRKGNII